MKTFTKYHVLGVCLSLLLAAGASSGSEGKRAVRDARGPQCGHWAVLRCCEILGVPLDMEAVMGLLPWNERGHSMLSIMKTMEAIGLKAEPREVRIDSLTEGTCPAVAHLKPDHYVVVVRADDQYVTLFDGFGRRTRRSTEEFRKQWSGKILRVHRMPGPGSLPAFHAARDPKTPCVQFDTLALDKGEIQDTGEPARFVFPFRNIGDSDLVIEQVKAACSCVKAEKPEEPIAPMQEGVITLDYSVEKTRGSFSQEAYVQTNDPVFPVIRLTASGNTERAVSVSPKSLNLGRVVANVPCSMSCCIEHSGDDPLEIRAIENDGRGVRVRYRAMDDYIRKQRFAGVMKNASRLEFLFTYDGTELGDRATQIHIATNITGYERITLPVTAHVVPPVEWQPGVLVFSPSGAVQGTEKRVTAVSANGKPFRIIRIDAAHLGLTCQFSPAPAHEVRIVFKSTPQGNGKTSKYGDIDVELAFAGSEERLTTKLPVCFW